MNFDESFIELLGHEGGYSNHKNDPGGETMWGVTKRVAVANGYTGNMRDLPVEFAKRIYRKSYWDAVQADSLPAEVRYSVFDAAVNSGASQAIKWLQRSVGVQDDGVLGPITLKAVTSFKGSLEAKFLGHRLLFMSNLKNWDSFSEGWAKRIANLLLKD